MSLRDEVLGAVELLSLPSKQLAYEREVPTVHAPSELICLYCDDLYHPKSSVFLDSFNEEELRELAHLYGVVVQASKHQAPTVTELLKTDEWRVVISVAKSVYESLSRAT
ncbi:hypothetical protein [uncultured Abyssibacter sp.]|uniref:hypothetical protein n=1 Tax=uncultured Abyssibacter sp. TaxID=2320202 RepID=UPI0032B21B3A